MDVLLDSRTSDVGRSLSPHLGQLYLIGVPDAGALFPTRAGCLHRRTQRPHPNRSLQGVRLLYSAICRMKLISRVALSSTFHSDLRFFAFVGGRLLTYSFRRLNLLVRLAARCHRFLVVVVVVIFCLVGLGKMGVALVERSSADDIVIVLSALEISFLSFAEFVDVH
jgi:hypothetical protein